MNYYCICDFLSNFLEPIPLLTLVIVIFTGWQLYIQKKAHTLNLFDKRWQALKDLQEIGKRAESWKHIYYQDNPSAEENYWIMFNKISLFADECGIIFNEEISKTGKDTAENFKEYHRILDRLEDWEKYHKEYPEQYTKEKLSNLLGLKANLSSKVLELFDKWYEEILIFIKSEKLN